jgi:GntR family transcriptional regulator/MocR family aminotransferase
VDLHVRLDGRRDLARQVYRQVRAAILDGRLRRGDRLPPTRELALRLGIARQTATVAYEWLAAEGLISGRRGAGSRVEGQALGRPARRAGAALQPRPVWDRLAAPEPRAAAPRYDFGVGAPDAGLFPFDAWRRLLGRQVRATLLDAAYGDPAGHPRLRAALARHVGLSRGVTAGPEDVVVTNGAQGAFDLVARVLVEPGATVVVEEPGYPPLRLLLRSCGARLRPVPVDGNGLSVEALPDEARLVFLTPAHQFPLGVPLSHTRRVALLDWARRRQAVLVEDDYDSEFRFGGRPLETLHALDRDGRVVYVSTFSKSLLPALRLGFLVAPPPLRRALRAAAFAAGWHAQGPAQVALLALIESGLLARHLRRARRVYAARHQAILDALRTDFGRWLSPLPSLTGLHLAARLRLGGPAFEREVAEQARRRGVGFDRLSAYYEGAPQAGLVLGYGALPDERVAEGLRRLRASFTAAVRVR